MSTICLTQAYVSSVSTPLNSNIFSFSKRAKVTGTDGQTAFFDLVEEVIAWTCQASALLEGPAKAVLDEFMDGDVTCRFSFFAPRSGH